jgi:hypothetical protein
MTKFNEGDYVIIRGDRYRDPLQVVRVDTDAWGTKVLTVREGKPCEDGATFRINEHMVLEV